MVAGPPDGRDGALPALPGAAMKTAVKALIVAVYAVVFWVFLPAGLWLLARGLDRAAGWSAAPSLAGCFVMVGGLAIVEWAFGILWLEGRTLPVSALPPSGLVRRGPYAIVRHPVYLGFNVAIFGAGLTVGSPALAWIVAPLFAPAWIAYARAEERFLVRRFGGAYRHYRRRVGMLPRLSLYPVVHAVQRVFRPLDATVHGREHIPVAGPVVLVFSHACYLDPGFVGVATRRPIRFLTTAQAYRRPLLAWFVRGFGNVPVRRYRPAPAACREMLRLLADGEVIGMAPEGERSVLGGYEGALPDVARIVARLGVPVVPVGISGNYDCGPRWAAVLRRRPVRVRVGSPLAWDPARPPHRVVDDAIRTLLDADPQPVHLDGLPPARIARALWRCPRCGDEAAWTAAALSCAACGARWTPTPEGRFRGPDGDLALADLGRAVRRFPEPGALVARALAFHEASLFAPIRQLDAVGEGELHVAVDELRFRARRAASDVSRRGEVAIALHDVRSTSIERGDTLQLALRGEMWQFRFQDGSAFRWQLAVDRWRRAERGPQPAESVR